MTISPIASAEVIEHANHTQRNALTPALVSVQILEERWNELTDEQVQKYLRRIKSAIGRQMELLEDSNREVAEGKIVVFRKREE